MNESVCAARGSEPLANRSAFKPTKGAIKIHDRAQIRAHPRGCAPTRGTVQGGIYEY